MIEGLLGGKVNESWWIQHLGVGPDFVHSRDHRGESSSIEIVLEMYGVHDEPAAHLVVLSRPKVTIASWSGNSADWP